MELRANDGREEKVEYSGATYERLPVKTCLVTSEHNLNDVLVEYVKPHLKKGDIVFVSEKMVSCSEGRTVKLEDVKVSRLARLLSRFVEPTYSEGLGLPQTMQTAIDEVGAIRIVFAAAAGAVGKILRRRGWFYVIAGPRVSHIDGPSLRTLPPYDQEIVLCALEPDKDAEEASRILGVDVVIVDANPVALRLCGTSNKDITEEWLNEVLRDNPLGQATQRTPCGIIRKV